MRRLLVALVLLAAGLAAGLAVAQSGEPTVATQTFTHEDVVTYTIPTVTETVVVTETVAPPPPPPPPGTSYVTADTIAFPKTASFLSYEFNGPAMSKFQMNIGRGCKLDQLQASFALNPQQINFAYAAGTGTCGGELGYSITYGAGYHAQTTSLTSPYPGIGTIRAIRESDIVHHRTDPACPETPTPCVTGQRWIGPFGHSELNLSNSGSDDTTAEWAARLRAHIHLEDVDGSFANKPYLHGVAADNFMWWDTWVGWQSCNSEKAGKGGRDDSRTGGPANCGGGTLPADPVWGHQEPSDTGHARNHEKLRQLLGPNVLLFGNAFPNACMSGPQPPSPISNRGGSLGKSGYAYLGEGPLERACNVGDAGLLEHLLTHEDEAAWADLYIPRLHHFQTHKANGRQKYGVLAMYGTCSGGQGHTLTAKDLRMGLAWASVGGWYFWPVFDCNWGTTVIPGGTNAIPEQGENATYPRGWLGQPTAAPAKSGAGQWKRAFAGGVVYLNAGDVAWSVDGRTVPANDALFVKT